MSAPVRRWVVECDIAPGDCKFAKWSSGRQCLRGRSRTPRPQDPRVNVCPVTRHLTDLSQKGYTPLVLPTSSFLTTRLRWVYFRSSFGCTPARGLALSFCSNAHHHHSLPQQLGVV